MVLLLLGGIVVMELWMIVGEQRKPNVQGERISQLRSEWMRSIRRDGANNAYTALKIRYAAEPHGKRHEMAHLFGEVLFQAAGENGIGACDADNEFGCYHGFLSMAVRSRGIGIIHDLDQACIRAWGPREHACQHGIGHGILEYLGRDKLIEALDLCAELSWKEEIGGCGGGVFMEYNLPTILTADGVDTGVRPQTDTSIYEPCDSIPSQYRMNCLFTLVQWWGRQFDHDFSKLGMLCMQLPLSKERTVCYEGIGQIAAPTTNYDVEKTIAACARMPNTDTMHICRRQASWSTWSSLPNRKDAAAVCSGLPDRIRSLCAGD